LFEGDEMKNFLYIVALIMLSSVCTAAHQVTVTCVPVSGAAGYNVYRSHRPDAYVKMTSTPISACSYVDSSVNVGDQYMYMVTYVNSAGVESNFSTPPAKVTIPVAPPTGVRAIAVKAAEPNKQ
jgi:fibronectin type 3 domain-containing protein